MTAAMFAKSNNYQFKDWYIESHKGRILASAGAQRDLYEREIKLPHLPDMLFPDNHLRLTHSTGFGIHFNPLDSLRLVDPDGDLIKVKVAKEWKESRAECEFIEKEVKPFDWTFTTSYKGTLDIVGEKLSGNSEQMKSSPTDEPINIEKLKVQESILFFDEVNLFEDELSDHGTCSLDIKIRVMPTSFFILCRFFLRVDGVVIRVNDTRIYHEIEKPYMIREYTERESLVSDLKEKKRCSERLFTEPNEIVQFLDVKKQELERLDFPSSFSATLSS